MKKTEKGGAVPNTLLSERGEVTEAVRFLLGLRKDMYRQSFSKCMGMKLCVFPARALTRYLITSQST